MRNKLREEIEKIVRDEAREMMDNRVQREVRKEVERVTGNLMKTLRGEGKEALEAMQSILEMMKTEEFLDEFIARINNKQLRG